MSVRDFDGTDDEILFSSGGVAWGYGSLWAVVYWDTVAAEQAFIHIDNAGTDRVSLRVTATGMRIRVVGGGGNSDAAIALSSGRWYLMGVSKATGSATPRFHVYDYTATTWTHANGGAALTDANTTQNTIRIGSGNTSQFVNGRVVAAAIKQGTALSDANFETLDEGVVRWFDFSPTALWLLSQASIGDSIADLTGNGANQSSIVGTSVLAVDSPIPLLAPVRYNPRRRVA